MTKKILLILSLVLGGCGNADKFYPITPHNIYDCNLYPMQIECQLGQVADRKSDQPDMGENPNKADMSKTNQTDMYVVSDASSPPDLLSPPDLSKPDMVMACSTQGGPYLEDKNGVPIIPCCDLHMGNKTWLSYGINNHNNTCCLFVMQQGGGIVQVTCTIPGPKGATCGINEDCISHKCFTYLNAGPFQQIGCD